MSIENNPEITVVEGTVYSNGEPIGVAGTNADVDEYSERYDYEPLTEDE